MRLKKGDLAYIVENHIRITPVKVVVASGGFCTVRFCNSDFSAIRVRDSRLFKTEEEASRFLNVIPNKEDKKKVIHSVPLH